MGFPVQIIENRKSKKNLVLIDFNEFSCDCLMLLDIFGFPFADADCDAFLSPVTAPRPVSPLSPVCSLDRPLSGLRLRLRTGRTVSHCQSRIRRRPAQAHTGPHLPHPRTQDSDKVLSAKIRLDSTDNIL